MTQTGSSSRLDASVLGRWLDANGAPGDGEQPVLEQLSGGSQNTLYLIQRGSERMVLRMPGTRADAARIDGLLREIRLVRALRGTDVPHAELIAANDAGDLLGMRDIGPAQRAYQSDLAQQPVDAGCVGAGAGHAQHHAMVAAMDQVQRVLRAAGQLLEDRFFAVAGSLVRVQPAPQYHRV